MLTQAKLKELFDYDPTTGVFVRLVTVSNQTVGNVVGCADSNGYLQVSIKGKQYYMHRLAFLFVEGYFPEHFVDHMNGRVTDNRWENLREASRSCNMQNCRLSITNKSGFIGVHWDKHAAKWKAQITINNKLIYIGLYKSATDAAIARVKYEDNCPGWSCNHQSNNRVKLRELGAI